MQMTSVSPTTSLIKLAKQQIRMLARSIVREGSCWVGTSGFLLLALRRSESMFVALDDWIRSGERKKGGWWFVWEVRPAPMWALARLGASVGRRDFMLGRNLLDGLPVEAKSRLRKRAQPKWVAPMLATLTDEVFSREGWLFEPKWDGGRCLAFRRGRDLNLFSRNRIRLNEKYPEVAETIVRQKTN